MNHRSRLEIREDGKGEVQVAGLAEVSATDSAALLGIIEMGNRNRTTHATESNDVSSRSHAICSVVVRSKNSGRIVGKLSLIDLAGSERGADTKSHNRQRRMEGAEINKSLLSLKECIRAIDCGSGHVPYRASKLTLVLKDAFTNKNSRTVMIVNVSPTASSADHTLNTLRYADRVKERKVGGGGGQYMQQAPQPLGADIARRLEPPQSKGNNLPPPPLEAKDDRRKVEEKRRGWDREAGMAQARLGYKEKLDDDEYSDDEDDEYAADKNQSQDDDLHQMHLSLRGSSGGDMKQPSQNVEDDSSSALESLHRTVEGLFQEEEALLNLHMNVIQENAELLTEEGRLLQQIQGEDVVDYDIGLCIRSFLPLYQVTLVCL